MKKITIILSVMCLFMVSALKAQDIKFGVKGGLNAGALTTSDAEWQKLTPGFEVGLYGQYNIMDILGVSLEPTFAKKGINDFDPLLIYSMDSPKLIDEKGNAISYKEQDLRLSMIQVPVLAQLNLDMGMNVRVFAGPSFDFITKATHSTTRELTGIGEDFTFETSSVADVTDRFVYCDYTAVIGVGFDIEMDPVDLRIDVKYQHGFTDLNLVTNKPSLYTRTFGVTVGVGLDKLILK